MTISKIIIVGAPRSGTNMLRDVLCKFDGVATWPCDEINYIWRHGNVKHATDEIPLERVTPKVSAYIRKQFDWVAQCFDAHTVVEKTCANSLRVPFVDRIIPEAKYVFIYRDGLDVVGSAMKRWKAELDIPYLARKARFVPLFDLPFYASRYLGNRIYRVVSREKRLAFWGPRFVGLDEAMEQHALAEVCALQWQRCVELSEDAFSRMPMGKVSRVSYETFVRSPDYELQRIANELSLALDNGLLARAVRNVSAGSIGKGRMALNEETTGSIRKLIGETLARYGYA